MAPIVRKMILSLIAKILIEIKLNCLSLIARSTHRLLSLIAIKLKKLIGRQACAKCRLVKKTVECQKSTGTLTN
jgi:hypothetical protein